MSRQVDMHIMSICSVIVAILYVIMDSDMDDFDLFDAVGCFQVLCY